MSRVADFFTFAFVVAGILVLTRPGSQGPGLVTAIGNGFSAIVQAVTGGGAYWPPAGRSAATTVGRGTTTSRVG